jgi:hypothetical protein
MRITKQSSQGRGEYELSEFAPNGLKPSDLVGIPICLRIGSHIFRTDVQLTTQGQKYRLRRVEGSQVPQIPIQVANVLLMPDPIRDETRLASGEPVLQNESYLIKNIHFGEVTHSEGDAYLVADVLTVDCANNTIQAEQIPAQQRMSAVEKVWSMQENFPPDIVDLLAQHERDVCSGLPIPKTTSRLVSELQRKVDQYSVELGVSYTHTTDVLPALLTAIGVTVEQEPIAIDQIEPDNIEVRRREIKKWHQYASRGPEGVRFRRKVQEAYRFRCIMCGSRFPSTSFNRNPGVDAAHILPWAEYDLDEVRNGIALCKLHHWAFDEGILIISFHEGKYYVNISEEAEQILFPPLFSLDVLRQATGEIPQDRLPSKESDWPSPQLLERYYSVLL